VRIRRKRFLTFFVLCAIPLILLVGINYWNGVRATESTLRRNLEYSRDNLVQDLQDDLSEHENDLLVLARSQKLQIYLSAQENLPLTDATLPVEVRSAVSALLSNRGNFGSIALFVHKRQVFFAERELAGQDTQVPVFHFGAFLPGQVQPNENVWSATKSNPLRSHIITSSLGASLPLTVPVFSQDQESGPLGALVGEVVLDSIFSRAAKLWEGRTVDQAKGMPVPTRSMIVIDNSGRILYQQNPALKFQSVANAMPEFSSIANRMLAGQTGWERFTSANREPMAVTYKPVPGLDVSIATTQNYSEVLASLRCAAWIGISASVLFASIAALLLAGYWERRTVGLERVTEGAAAIARGKLDHRIELLSSDQNRLLADNVNLMTERLRKQISRETEARQFQSFVRLSAMLTHDLKNSIEVLSLIVGNMERHFDNEEFRADAMKSLNIATQNLRALVARLSKPVTTLSGEFKRPQPVDLVPMLERSLAIATGSVAGRHEIETLLPPSVLALVDGERIEKVVENLVFNALEAMSAKPGKLTVAAGQAGAGNVFFSVTDTGTGMSREFIEGHLYRPFATTKRKGVGLGLYTCREIVSANLGSIEVDSKEGAGTTFRVVLPSATIERTD
jgi:signal transduction histidine kinase